MAFLYKISFTQQWVFLCIYTYEKISIFAYMFYMILIFCQIKILLGPKTSGVTSMTFIIVQV